MARQSTRSKEDKAGSGRVAFDQAAALEALVWAQGGQQLELLPGRALRLVGAAPAPDDGEEGEAGPIGRPPGAKSLAPEAWRRWLTVRYGSVIEGMVRTGTAPVAATAAELVQAYQAVYLAVNGAEAPALSSSQILELVTGAAQMRLTAQRYAAPYQHSQAPQPVKAEGVVHRIAIGLFADTRPAGGRVSESVEGQALAVLAGMLDVDPATITNPLRNNETVTSDAIDLNAVDLNAPSSEEA